MCRFGSVKVIHRLFFFSSSNRPTLFLFFFQRQAVSAHAISTCTPEAEELSETDTTPTTGRTWRGHWWDDLAVSQIFKDVFKLGWANEKQLYWKNSWWKTLPVYLRNSACRNFYVANSHFALTPLSFHLFGLPAPALITEAKMRSFWCFCTSLYSLTHFRQDELMQPTAIESAAHNSCSHLWKKKDFRVERSVNKGELIPDSRYHAITMFWVTIRSITIVWICFDICNLQFRFWQL